MRFTQAMLLLIFVGLIANFALDVVNVNLQMQVNDNTIRFHEGVIELFRFLIPDNELIYEGPVHKT